jgi:hypothetical protein
VGADSCELSDFSLLKLSANRLSSIFRNLFVGIKVNEMMKPRCVYWHISGEAKLKLKAETNASGHWPRLRLRGSRPNVFRIRLRPQFSGLNTVPRIRLWSSDHVAGKITSGMVSCPFVVKYMHLSVDLYCNRPFKMNYPEWFELL